MKRFKDWRIRNKLVLPLFAVLALGGSGIILTLVEMHDVIINDALPEERALKSIRSASFQLLSEYHELMLGHSEAIEFKIEQLKEKIELHVAAFEEVVGIEEIEAGLVEAIDAAEQELKRVGGEAVATRFRLLDHMASMEAFEVAIEHVIVEGPASAEPVEDRQVPELDELFEEYISELREYVLGPNDTTLREIAEIEQYLERILRARDERASERGDQAQDADKLEPVRRLLEAGRLIGVLSSEFLAKHDELEAVHFELLEVLDNAVAFAAQETDEAFETGFVSVAGIFVTVLVIVSLVGYAVTQQIAKSVTALANAADRFGDGDLDARADVGGGDEIGGLATAFNQMAQSVQENTVSRFELSMEVAERKRAEEKINASLAEKEVLLEEIHHRVKNNLQVISSMLSLQVGTTTDNRSIEALVDSQRRVKVMARIHENLHQSDGLTSINAREYLNSVVEDTIASSGDSAQRISASFDVDDFVINVDHAVACGQIVGELYSNSLKHAFSSGQSGNIEVALHRKGGDRIELTVADDGTGLPEDFDLRQAETLGMRLIHALTMQLGGEVNVDGSGGTRVQIQFPEKQL